MKTSLIAITALLTSGALTGAIAVVDKVHDMHHTKINLKMNPDQGKAFHARILEFKKAKLSITEDSSLTAEQKKQKVASLQTKAEGDVKKLLTADQLKMLNAHGGVKLLFSAMHEQGMAAQMHEVLSQLDLSPDQQAKVHKLFSETQKQMEAINADKGLSDGAKKDKISALHNDAMGQMHSILTNEQLEKAMKLMGHSQ